MRRSIAAIIVALGFASAAAAQVPGGAPGGQTFAPPTATAPVRVPDLKRLTDPVGANDLLILTHQTQISPVPEYVTRAMTIQQLMGTILGVGTAGQVGIYASGGSTLSGQGPFTAGLPVLGNGVLGLQSGGRTGSTTTYAATTGVFVNGDCRSTDANLNEIDAGGPCTIGGGGGTVNAASLGQLAIYLSNGNAVSGFGSGKTGQILTSGGPGALPTWSGPVLNASGSQAVSTGTIGAGTSSLSLTAAGDWVNGEGILIPGAGATFTGSPATGLGFTVVGTGGSTPYAYSISCVDTNGGQGSVTANIANANGNATLGLTNFNKITWAQSAGCSRYAVYGNKSGSMNLMGFTFSTFFEDHGRGAIPVPIWASPTAPSSALNDWLLTSVSSGGGTTALTLAAPSTHAVSGGSVYHEDSASLQAAINALPSNGGPVNIGSLTYNVAHSISLGNGSTGVASTTSGMILQGSAMNVSGIGWTAYGSPKGAQLNWIGSAAAPVVLVAGPVQGWGLNNVTLQCNDSATYGLLVSSGQFGSSSNGYAYTCQFGIDSGTVPAFGGNNTDSLHNIYTHWAITNADYNQSYGLRLDGDDATGTSDTDYNNFTDFIISASTTAKNQGIYFLTSDTNFFYGIHLSGSWATYGDAITFDYGESFGAGNAYPSAAIFFGLDAQPIVNNGAPTTAAINIIYGMGGANGANCLPSLAGLSCHVN